MNLTTEQQIAKGRVIAILRGAFDGQECAIADALALGGITALEVTLNSPNALNMIQRLAHHCTQSLGSQSLAIGAGTVLTADEVAQVAQAGGTFIVSPNRDVRVIERTKQLGMLSFPGCYTPSEIVEAVQAGADAVKLFPATALGVGYVKAVRAPLADVRLIPTGGVTPALAREYRAAGAWAVGIGSELIPKNFQASPEQLGQLTARAKAFTEAMQDAAH